MWTPLSYGYEHRFDSAIEPSQKDAPEEPEEDTITADPVEDVNDPFDVEPDTPAEETPEEEEPGYLTPAEEDPANNDEATF